jgi:hypothetical protein
MSSDGRYIVAWPNPAKGEFFKLHLFSTISGNQPICVSDIEPIWVDMSSDGSYIVVSDNTTIYLFGPHPSPAGHTPVVIIAVILVIGIVCLLGLKLKYR